MWLTIEREKGVFPGGQVVRTLYVHGRRCGCNPWLVGELRSHKSHSMAKIKREKESPSAGN